MSLHYDMKEADQELYPGTLRGYRCWRISRDGLVACNFHTVWGPGPNVAICQMSTHKGEVAHKEPAPQMQCTCGFYATYDQSFPRPMSFATIPSLIAAGSIKASGRVILGTKGFRAEKAEVEALVSESRELDRHTAERYNVPIFDSWPEMLEAFPPVDVEALVGPLPPPGAHWTADRTHISWRKP